MINIGKIYEDGFKAGEQSKWIPCSEKTPKKYETCLITYKYNGLLNVSMATFQKLGFYLCDTALPCGDYDVIAWMPLPEAYKEEENE